LFLRKIIGLWIVHELCSGKSLCSHQFINSLSVQVEELTRLAVHDRSSRASSINSMGSRREKKERGAKSKRKKKVVSCFPFLWWLVGYLFQEKARGCGGWVVLWQWQRWQGV